MTEDVTLNDLIAFCIEVTVLALLCTWGFRSGNTLAARVALGIGVPLVAIGVWALFAAPDSVFEVLAAEVVVRVLVLGSGALAAFRVLPATWARPFAALVVANTVLLYIGPFAH